MTSQELFTKLRQAVIGLDDEEVSELLREGVSSGVAPIGMIVNGLNPGLNAVGELVKRCERPVSDMVLASEIMHTAMCVLIPVMKAGGQSTGETMIIGTVEGDQHNVEGKRIVAALFTGAGYRVVDLGENVPASEFARAALEYEATIVGASALAAYKRPCKAIAKALSDTGIRNDVIYIVGGWGIDQEWCDSVGADTYGKDAADALEKVKGLMSGDLLRWSDRVTT